VSSGNGCLELLVVDQLYGYIETRWNFLWSNSSCLLHSFFMSFYSTIIVIVVGFVSKFYVIHRGIKGHVA
jgi:hypothetical protein